jgi:hypothetical protein
MASVRKQAGQHGATGVAGMKISKRLDEIRLTGGEGDVYEREHHNLVISVIGTSIRGIPNVYKKVRATQMVLSLGNGKLGPVAIGSTDAEIE